MQAWLFFLNVPPLVPGHVFQSGNTANTRNGCDEKTLYEHEIILVNQKEILQLLRWNQKMFVD
jgi:hypothetical protein